MFRRPALRPATSVLRPAPERSASGDPVQCPSEGFVDALGPGRSPAESAWRWCRAARRKDAAAAEALLAQDVVLHGPLTDTFRFEGRAEVAGLLAMVFRTVDRLDYHTNVGEGATRVVAYHGRVHGVDFEEYLVLSFDEQHRVCHIVVAVRGMAGLAAMMSSLGPQLLAANHTRWSARLAKVGLSAATRGVVALDRWIVPLSRPVRDRT